MTDVIMISDRSTRQKFLSADKSASVNCEHRQEVVRDRQWSDSVFDESWCWNSESRCSKYGWPRSYKYIKYEQEAQLIQTKRRDAFSGKSRSPVLVPFNMLGIVSSCAIVTLSLFLQYPTSKNVVTLKSESEFTQGHWKWYHSIDRAWFPISVL